MSNKSGKTGLLTLLGPGLLVAATGTWTAYNDWGGPSYYTGGHVSSLERPLPKGFLAKPDPLRVRAAALGDVVGRAATLAEQSLRKRSAELVAELDARQAKARFAELTDAVLEATGDFFPLSKNEYWCAGRMYYKGSG